MYVHTSEEDFIKIKICIFCVKKYVLLTCCLQVLVIIGCISEMLQLNGTL